MDEQSTNRHNFSKKLQLPLNKIGCTQQNGPHTDFSLGFLTARVGKTSRRIVQLFGSKKKDEVQPKSEQKGTIRRSKSDSYILFANEHSNVNITLTPLPELPPKFRSKLQAPLPRFKPNVTTRRSQLKIGMERKNKLTSQVISRNSSASLRHPRKERHSLYLPHPPPLEEEVNETNSNNYSITTNNNCNIPTAQNTDVIPPSFVGVPADVPIPPPIAQTELSSSTMYPHSQPLLPLSSFPPPPPPPPPLSCTFSSTSSPPSVSLSLSQGTPSRPTLPSASLLPSSSFTAPLKPFSTSNEVKVKQKEKRSKHNSERKSLHPHALSKERQYADINLLELALPQQHTPIPLPNDLIFDPQTNALVAAPISSFVTYVILNSLRDATLLKSFLLTHLHFMSSEELLKILINFYEESQKADKKEDSHLIQIRVLNVIKKWFQYGMQEFAHNHTLGAALNQFIAKLEKSGESNRTFASLLKSAMATLYGQTLEKNLSAAPVPVLSRKVKELIKESAKTDGKLRKGVLTTTDIHPIELARQLTLLDFQLLTKVRPSELLNGRFTREETSPNIAALAKRFQKVSQWIATEIVTVPSTKRPKMISHFILVAENLVQLQNYHSAMSFVTGLSHFIVSRFDKAWKEIGKEMSTKFKELEGMFLPTGNWKNLRPVYEKARPPMIPPSPMILKDLMFIEEGNADHWNNDPKLLNIIKLQLLGRIVAKLQSCQEVPYQLFPVALIQQFLDDLYVLNDLELKKSTMNEL